ncbi:MAG: 2-phosphosulfolactate phosphatase [Arenicellales bacterium]
MREGGTPGGPAVHVLMRKEELDPARIADKTVVVVDVLFATTTIAAVLDHGASRVYPVADAAEGRALAALPGMDQAVLAGETMFRFIDGFAPPTPLALCPHVAKRGTLIYATTNGTVALKACAGARRVLVGSLINAGATVDAIDVSRRDTILVLCAGTAGAFNLEDFYGAGCLVERLAGRVACRLTDAAQAARDAFRASDAEPVLRRSRVGRLMHKWGLDSEVAFAARVDRCRVAAELHGDHVRTLE